MKAILPHNSRWAGFGSDPFGPDDPRIAREVIDSLFLVTTDRDVPDWVQLSGRMDDGQASVITSYSSNVGEAVKRAHPGYFGTLAFWLGPRHVLVAVSPYNDAGPTAASFSDRAIATLSSVPGVVSAAKLSGPEYFAYVIEGRPVGSVEAGDGSSGGGLLEDEEGPPSPGNARNSSSYKVPAWAWAVAGGLLVAVALATTKKRV